MLHFHCNNYRQRPFLAVIVLYCGILALFHGIYLLTRVSMKQVSLKKTALSLMTIILLVAREKIWNASRICVSSLRRGHANLLCIIPILAQHGLNLPTVSRTMYQESRWVLPLRSHHEIPHPKIGTLQRRLRTMFGWGHVNLHCIVQILAQHGLNLQTVSRRKYQ